MPLKHFFLLLVVILTCQPLAIAQTPSDKVTFVVPLNLTQLPSYVTKVAVACQLSPTPRGVKVANQLEFPVTYGKVVTTASIEVSVPADLPNLYKTGQSVTYTCGLTAFVSSPKYSGWEPFGKTTMAGPLDVSPIPSPLTGSFVW